MKSARLGPRAVVQAPARAGARLFSFLFFLAFVFSFWRQAPMFLISPSPSTSMRTRGQASSEFLLVLALIAAAILPLLLILAWNSRASPEQLSVGIATSSASRLAAAVNSVGSLGPGAALRTQIVLPRVLSVSAQGREIVIDLNTSYGPVALVQPTRFNISSSGFERINREGTYIIDVRGPGGPDAQNVTLTLP